jgi:hypothetical protein
MTPALPPDRRDGAGGSGGGNDKPDRPYSMLPRVRGGVEIDPDGQDLALMLAENWYPSLSHIDQIRNKQERLQWLLITGALLRGQEALKRYIEQFSQIFKPAVDAQVNDTISQGAAEERERRLRRVREIEVQQAELARIAQQEGLDQEEWQLKKKEREAALRRSNQRQDVGLVMAIITFCCALIAFFIGLASGDSWIIGGSLVAGLTALVTVAKLVYNHTPDTGSSP